MPKFRTLVILIIALIVAPACAVGLGPLGCSNDPPQDLIFPLKEQDIQLKTLYDYTIFHMGVYVTLTAAILAALNYKAKSWLDFFFIVPLVGFAGAGVCCGIVGSSIPRYVTYNSNYVIVDFVDSTITNRADFKRDDPNIKVVGGDEVKKKMIKVTPFLQGTYSVLGSKLTFDSWIALEHGFFWFGAFTLIAVVITHVVFVQNKWIEDDKQLHSK